MALPSILHDFQIGLSHVDRSIDRQLSLKVARHPSETLERLWLRVLAYCWQWEERLAFGPGLCAPDEPDLEARDYTGQVTRWVRVGKSDALKVQRAIDQHPGARVAVLFDAPARLEGFLAEAREARANRVARAELAAVEPALLSWLAAMDGRRAKLTVTLVGDHFYLDRGGSTFDGPLTRGALQS